MINGFQLTLVLVLVAWLAPRDATAQAANYELIRVDAGLAGGYSKGVESGGFGGMVEPKLMLHDNVTVGLRVEGMVTFGANVGRGSDELSIASGSVAATLVKAEYLFGNLAVRPVVGLSAGLYSIGGEAITTSSDSVGVSQRAGRYFGVAPQVGLELGRVRLAVSYNAIVGASIEVEQTVGEPQSRRDFSQNYYSFELSFHFGGTRLDRPAAGPPGKQR